MKLLAALLLLSVSAHRLAAQETAGEYVFCIKVAASKTPLAKTAQLYKDFPDAQALAFPDGYIRYFVGAFETFHRAKESLPAVQAKGYKDAYVVCLHDGKILTGDEAIMEIYEGDK